MGVEEERLDVLSPAGAHTGISKLRLVCPRNSLPRYKQPDMKRDVLIHLSV